MTREEAARVLKYLWIERDENAKLMQQLTKSFFERQEALRIGAAALRQGWVRTAERAPEGDEHKEILGLYKGKYYYLYDIVQIGWLRLHPEMYPYWTRLLDKLEVEG